MNKELEALENIKVTLTSSKISDYWGYKYYLVSDIEAIKKDFATIEKALKRNEPMKVDLKTKYALPYSGTYYACPKCGITIIKRYYNCCPNCEQKLDWSEENEK